MIKVSEVMTTNPLVLGSTDTVGQADELMAEHRIRQLPVVDRGELIGIVTDRDLRSFLSGRLFTTPGERDVALLTPVSEIMTTDPITVGPDDDLRETIEILIEEKIGGLPVTDAEGRLVGIVTYVDVLRCFLEHLESESERG